VTKALADLVALLDLEVIEVNTFRGSHLDETRQRVFGGQVAAQSLVAAGRTVERGRVHSLHSYFLRPGDPLHPILYEVDRIRDGRSFTTRRVVAIQHGKAIFNLQCSFHVDEESLVHEIAMPEAPDAESLPTIRERLEGTDTIWEGFFELPRPIDQRFVGELPWTRSELGSADAHQQLWFRADGKLPDDPLLHAAVVTYASDMTLYDSILQPHRIGFGDEHFMGASLDHCMWFHRPFRADEWLLFDQESPAAFGARGLARGLLFSEGGNLVVSVVQEGLLRIGDKHFRRQAPTGTLDEPLADDEPGDRQ
jgi:acyl-CoA thioesterase-2